MDESKPNLDESGLLTDEEMGNLLDLDIEFTYLCSDKKVATVDCHNLIKAQRDLTASKMATKYEKRIGEIEAKWQAKFEELIREIEKNNIADIAKMPKGWLLDYRNNTLNIK